MTDLDTISSITLKTYVFNIQVLNINITCGVSKKSVFLKQLLLRVSLVIISNLTNNQLNTSRKNICRIQSNYRLWDTLKASQREPYEMYEPRRDTKSMPTIQLITLGFYTSALRRQVIFRTPLWAKFKYSRCVCDKCYYCCFTCF